ncbi:MAG: hypothetical protein JWO36_4154 [Myxococcales bacterium]|nr:hypothetical protein [Myxococcales bacterium]
MRAAIFIAVIVTLACSPACSDSANTQKDAGVKDGGVDGGGGPDASCFTNPMTHYEIINACTGSQKIYKVSHPALLGSDGTLPALP